VEISVVDENIESIDFEEVVDLVGITGYTCYIPRAYEIADEYRSRGVPVVIGGIHASMLPNEVLEHADSVVIGEAEEIWPKLVDDFKNRSLQKIYKAESQPNLQNALVPRWDISNADSYSNFTIQTGRGCPNDCGFCSVHVMNGRKCRHKPIEILIEEIKLLRKINKNKSFLFADDNLLAVPKYAKDFLKAIKPLNIKFTIQASIDRLDNEEMLSLLADAGCIMVFIGFESVSQKSLDSVNKSRINNVDRYKEVVEKVHSAGIEIMGSFILGLEDDDKDTFKNVTDFINEANILFAMINILTPLPGTRLYLDYKNNNRITRTAWNDYNGESVCIRHDSLSEEELLKGRVYILRRIYSYKILHKKLRYLARKGAYDLCPRPLKESIALVITSLLSGDPERALFISKCLWGFNRVSIGSLIFALSLHDHAYSDTLNRK
jgi:radical SAM superfamily enzyme YgiQ (UPF0313 family)